MMKNINCPVMITEEENWYVAKEINTNIASQGKTVKEAVENLKEALELYFQDNNCDVINKNVLFTTLEVKV
jgi:predicted RNase H-like HicB family nuclease